MIKKILAFMFVFLFFVFCDSSVAESSCKNLNSRLSYQQKKTLENNIKKQLNVDHVDILDHFKEKEFSISYIETTNADEAFLFYDKNELVNNFIVIWSGAAKASEKKDIEKWAKDNVTGIPDNLAQCFAWYAVYRHD